jgi:hypothetical protein
LDTVGPGPAWHRQQEVRGERLKIRWQAADAKPDWVAAAAESISTQAVIGPLSTATTALWRLHDMRLDVSEHTDRGAVPMGSAL